MNKKLYLPNEEELQIIDKYGDLIKYLKVKVVEYIVLVEVLNQTGSLLKHIPRSIVEDKDIYRSISLMYPNEVKMFSFMIEDFDLCLSLLDKDDRDNRIYNLDNLALFNNYNFNDAVKVKVIDMLYNLLPITPKYRFKYKHSNLLETIFSCNIDYKKLDNTTFEKLTTIEPAYFIKAYMDGKYECYNDDAITILFSYALDKYASRYGIKSNELLMNNKQNTISKKKLLKTINYNKNVIY